VLQAASVPAEPAQCGHKHRATALRLAWNRTTDQYDTGAHIPIPGVKGAGTASINPNYIATFCPKWP